MAQILLGKGRLSVVVCVPLAVYIIYVVNHNPYILTFF
jgi:hypothetical protein